MSLVGLSYRGALGDWLDAAPREVECVEVLAEHFLRAGCGRLAPLREHYPLVIHTERLSPGAPGADDEAELAALAGLVEALRPQWISDHLGFRCTREIDLGSPVPMLLNRRSLDLVAGRVARVMQACQVPVLLENLNAPLMVMGEIAEPAFLNQLCERCGCGVLLDVTALAVSAHNRGFDALGWLDQLNPAHIVQVHVGGCRERDGRRVDAHDAPVAEDTWALLTIVLERGPVQAVVLERDASFPPVAELAHELGRIRMLTRRGETIGSGDPAS